MFTVDEAAVAAIRQAFREEGELAAVVELRRRFPLLESTEHATSCVRAIASWTPSSGTDDEPEHAAPAGPDARTNF